MRCPFAKWIGTPDHFGYPAGTHGQLQPLAICDHIMCGTLAGCDAWFNGGGLSAHFGIGKNGDIHQYVELEDCAWANGAVANPDPSLAYIYENHNPNVVTWSIEHEGWPSEPWTAAMYQASLKLKRWLLEQEPVAIVGHFQFDSVSRNNCPGPNWPIKRFLADLKEEEGTEDQFAQFRGVEIHFMNLADACHGVTLACQMRVISAIRHNWGESTDEEMLCWSNLAGAYRAEIDAAYKALERCSWLGRPG